MYFDHSRLVGSLFENRWDGMDADTNRDSWCWDYDVLELTRSLVKWNDILAFLRVHLRWMGWMGFIGKNG